MADLAGVHIRRYHAAETALDMADAMIAATAVHHGLLLVTYNARHFPTPEVKRYTGGV